MTIIINVLGIGLICLVIWWFWIYKPKISVISGENVIEILVKDGVYVPPYIQIPLNTPVTLRFIRRDASPCAEIVRFESLNVTRQLSLNESTDIHLQLENAGVYEFTCQMGMYRGELIVK